MASSSLLVPKSAPKIWNNNELRWADALDCNRQVRKTDLNNNVHTIFERKRWIGITDADYHLLLPSIRLATLLVEVGMPYLTNFLPSKQLHDKFGNGKLPSADENFSGFAERYWVSIKPIAEVSDAGLRATRKELDEVANYVTWRLDNTMFEKKTWLGITRLVSDKHAPPPWGDLTAAVIDKADYESKGKGLTRRPLLIGIMRQYVDALRQYGEDTEPHIRARFLAGYTMAHEIGHVVWDQDFRSTDYDEEAIEPWVAADPVSELGSSFMSWVFGGYDPNIRAKEHRVFENNLVWTYRPRPNSRKRTDLYVEKYSISLKYMEDILNQSVWSAMGKPYRSKVWSEASRKRFTPDVSSSATATRAEWTIQAGVPTWISGVYSERRLVEGAPKVTGAEIKAMRLIIGPSEDEDDGEDNFFQSPAHEIMHVSVATLPARRIVDGVLRQNKKVVESQSKTTLTRVEVKYRTQDPRLAAIKKRPRSGDQDDDGDDNNRAKYMRVDDYDLEDESEIAARDADKDVRFSDKQDYDCRDVHQVLENMSVESVKGLTMYGVQLYCLKHDIKFPYDFEADAAWQEQRLNEEQHLGLISRVRMFGFATAEARFAKAMDRHALLLIKKARIESLKGWMVEDIKTTLIHEGQIWSEGDPDEMIKRLARFYYDQIEALQTPESGDIMSLNGNDPRNWTDDEQANFLRRFDLPLWGDREVKLARFSQFKMEVQHPEGVTRKEINKDDKGYVRRTSDNGIETYAWDLVLQTTCVKTLKYKLYRKAKFPSNCSLELYFGTDRQTCLEDNELLGSYDPMISGGKSSPVNWKDLWVKLTFPEPKANPRVESTRPVYQRRGLKPLSGPRPRANNDGKIVGLNSDSRRAGTMTSSTKTDKGNTTSFSSEVPNYLKRAQHIIDHPEEKTLAELMESINNNRASLEKGLQASGGFDSALKANGSLSKAIRGVEILDNLQDLAEEEEERRMLVRHETTNPDGRPEIFAHLPQTEEYGGDGKAPKGAPNHMLDLYDLIPEGDDDDSPPSSPSSTSSS